MKILLLFAILLSSCMAANEPEPMPVFRGIGWVSFGSNVSDTVTASLTRTAVVLSRGTDTLLYDTLRHAHLSEGIFCAVAKSYGDSAFVSMRVTGDSIVGSYGLDYDNGIPRVRYIQVSRQ